MDATSDSHCIVVNEKELDEEKSGGKIPDEEKKLLNDEKKKNQFYILSPSGTKRCLHNELKILANVIADKPTRSKFQTIKETQNMNKDIDQNMDTAHNINTEETETSYNISPELKGNNEYSQSFHTHEFSVSTLDKKLKQIRKNKLTNKKMLGDARKIKDFVDKETSSTKINVTIDPAKLISRHLHEIQLRIIGHNRAALMYDKQDRCLGFPVTILSTFIASTLMMSINSDEIYDKQIIKYVGLVLSILSFFFNVTRDYLKLARKFQSHDLSAKLYTTVLRSTEVCLIKDNLSNEEKKDIFKDIVNQMSIIEQYETDIPYSISSKIIDENIFISNI